MQQYTSNSALLVGGGLAACGDTIRNNTIQGNSAPQGGGLWGCWGTLRNNLITGNFAYTGGAIYAYNYDLVILNCTLADNWAGRGNAVA